MKTISPHSMLDNTQIYIVDFEDSFTFNIANVLYPFCQNIRVINYKIFFTNDYAKIINKNNIAVILGPGPGHPEQYAQYFPQIKALLNKNKIYLMGICLGHQLIALQAGYQIIPANPPIHGRRVPLIWDKHRYFIQRYNSLAVSPLRRQNEVVTKNEVMILLYKNGRSYQFHPESIGTDTPIHFFSHLLQFIGVFWQEC